MFPALDPLRRLGPALTLAAAILVTACGSGSSGSAVPPTGPTEPLGPIPPAAAYPTDGDRASGIGATLLTQMQVGASGASWSPDTASGGVDRTAYSGDAGVVLFLARLQRERPHPEIRKALQLGAARLLTDTTLRSPSLFEGKAGVGWALLEAGEVLGDPALQKAAFALGSEVAANTTLAADRPGDLFGHGGLPLFLLRLHRASGDARWLEAARSCADAGLARATATGDGLKFVWQMDRPYYYVGFSHGAAGAGFMLCRLAEALGPVQGRPYLEAALKAGRYVQSMAHETPAGLNYSRREPDQPEATQLTWCHGAPGIGLFWLELYRQTKEPQYLALARRCADSTGQTRSSKGACLCHGGAGNAWLALSLYRVLGEKAYLETAQAWAAHLWSQTRLLDRQYPTWLGDDGSEARGIGLYTGMAGIGCFYLSLHRNGQAPMPFLD